MSPVKCLSVIWVLVTSQILAKKTLHVMHLTSIGYSFPRPNVDFALDMLNNRSDILPEYDIVVHHAIFKKQNIGEAMKYFFDMVFSPPRKIFILGPTFTSEAKVVAATAQHFNLVQISFSASSPIMTDRETYPLFARTITNSALNNPAIIRVMEEFNWKKTAKIMLDYEYITSSYTPLQYDLDLHNMSIISSATYNNDPTLQLKLIKESGAKIILSFTVEVEDNPRLFCRVYQEGMYGSRYQWIHWTGNYGFTSQLTNDTGYNDGCTYDMMKTAMEGVISFMPVKAYIEEGRNKKGITGYTLTELETLYEEFLNRSGIHLDDLTFYTSIIDGVWAMGLALHNSIEGLNAINQTLDDFKYNDSAVAQTIFNEILKLKFFGASGSVSFDKNGDRMNSIGVVQIQDGETVLVAYYDPETNILRWTNDTRLTFHGGNPPSDSTRIVQTSVRITIYLFYIFGSLAVLGICYCLTTVIFNIKYRKTKLIKMSSPRINSMMAGGCCLSYISVILTGLDWQIWIGLDAICVARVWVLVYGFTFAFGSMFSKTWRIHRLFTGKKLQRTAVRDVHLIFLVLVVLAVDTIILIIWRVVDPLHWEMILLHPQPNARDDGVIYQPVVYVCTSHYSLAWSGFFYVFKAVLIIFGIFFAWETRHIRIEALNDSKQIAICVYNVMILSVISVPLINLLSTEQVNISYGVQSTAILICATATLTLVFGLKIHTVIQNRGKVEDMATIFFATSLQSTISTARGREFLQPGQHVDPPAEAQSAGHSSSQSCK